VLQMRRAAAVDADPGKFEAQLREAGMDKVHVDALTKSWRATRGKVRACACMWR
jgi:hypothetical protein